MSIVECAHIRGWLRKLDAAVETESRRKVDAETAQLRSIAEGWAVRELDMNAELASLLKAESRHLAATADERACLRAHDLRRHLASGRIDANNAAAKLAITEPSLPSTPKVEPALMI